MRQGNNSIFIQRMWPSGLGRWTLGYGLKRYPTLKEKYISSVFINKLCLHRYA